MKNQLTVKQHSQFSNIKEFCNSEKVLFNVVNQRMTDEEFEETVNQISVMPEAIELLKSIAIDDSINAILMPETRVKLKRVLINLKIVK